MSASGGPRPLTYPVGLGVIGCGGIATSAHLPAIDLIRHKVRLVCVADVRADAARAAAERHNADTWTTDYRELLARDDIQVVDICTPYELHEEHTVAAARAGKHVICEKPIATTLAEADRMLAACREAGVRLMIAHSRRFSPRYVALRAEVDSGSIGEVRLVKEQERRPWPQHGPHFRPRPGAPERETVLALNIGIHECDLFRWFMASDAESVFAEHRAPDGDYGYLAFTIRFRNGGLAIGSVSTSQPPGYPVFHEMEVYGTRGVARVRDHELQTLQTFSEAAGMQYPIARESLLSGGSAYRDEIEGFVDACLTGGPLPLAAEEGRAALELVQAVIRSYQTGREVALPLDAATALEVPA